MENDLHFEKANKEKQKKKKLFVGLLVFAYLLGFFHSLIFLKNISFLDLIFVSLGSGVALLIFPSILFLILLYSKKEHDSTLMLKVYYVLTFIAFIIGTLGRLSRIGVQ